MPIELHIEPIALTVGGRPSGHSDGFDLAVRRARGEGLRASSVRTLQVNIGLRCNLACHHCHVVSGPNRTEEMDWETMQTVLDVARMAEVETVDITGGAPEMHPHFRRFVSAARAAGRAVLVRTNLTILLQPGFEDLPEFLARRQVHLIASLPCYLEVNVDRQRGRQVYVESIEALRRLNALGYGVEPELLLDLVYNPLGPTLPPSQEALEADYRRELDRQFGIRFSRLYAITNMPIGRFQRDLDRVGRGEEYLRTLRHAFNPATLDDLMCRHQIHVSHDGSLHDCDFNYALGLGVDRSSTGGAQHVRDLRLPGALEAYAQRRVVVRDHCFGCAAGSGSSCGGSLTGADSPRQPER